MDIFYPVAIVSEFATLRSEDADVIKTLYLGYRLEGLMFWLALGFGIGMIVLSAPTAVLMYFRMKKDRASSRAQYRLLASVAEEGGGMHD